MGGKQATLKGAIVILQELLVSQNFRKNRSKGFPKEFPVFLRAGSYF